MIVKEKAPVRISFGSSGDSDYFFDVVEKANALNVSIDKYAYTEIHPRKDDKIVLRSLETGEVLEFDSLDDIEFNRRELNIMKAVVKHFKTTGIEVITHTDAPLESGLGGSAAHAVSLIKAFCELNQIQMSKEDIAKLAYNIERKILGIEGGHQDQWASSLGGLNYMHFTRNTNSNDSYFMNVSITPLNLSEKDLQFLENSFLLIHIPREKSGREVHLEQRGRSQETLAILSMKYSNIEKLRECLKNRQFEKIGELLHLDWKIKKQLASSITSSVIDKIYDAALQSGATGGRVIGAGAGGSMLLWCPNKRNEVLNALKEFGVREINFRFERVENEISLKDQIHEKIQDHREVIESLINSSDIKGRIELITVKLIQSYRNGGKLIVFGNGGSAADAQHIVAELVNKINIDRPMLNAIALTTNMSIITAISNDTNYDDVFSRQIGSLAEHNDVVIGISTSGKAENVMRALKKAKERDAFVVYFTGKTGGKISEVLERDGTIDVSLKIPSTYTPRIQEAHILAGHIICELVEHELYGK